MALEVQTGKPCLDVSRYELTVNGKRVKLERQPMDLLILFVQRKGELVTRQEIIDRLWGKNVFVDVDRSINSAIRKIRAALRDDPTAPKFLETVVGKGYRFIGEIDVVDPRSAAPQTMPQNQPAAPHPSSTPRHRSLAFLITGALVLLMATFIWSVIRTRRSGPALGYSIAVLPLANLSGDPSQDYLAQGMTDDLITELAKISSLRVISRTSSMHYAGSTRPLPEIARELRVDAIVEGALVRSGDKLKLTVQLIDAKSDKHLWAERYERDLRDVLSMQYEVAQAISDHLNGNVASVGSAVPVRRHTVSPEAYEAYQRGRFFWSKWTEDGVRKSIEYYQQAIQADPDYAMAYAGLADSYISLGDFAIGVLTPQQSSDAAEAAALKAISLDDSLAEAHSALAMARFRYGHLAEDEREFKRALELNPGSVAAHHFYSHYLLALGRDQGALAEGEKAYDLSPVDPEMSVHLSYVLWDLHQYDKAIALAIKGLELDPNFAETHQQLGQAYEQQGKYKEATAEMRKAVELSGRRVMVLSALGHILAVSGDREGALRILAEFEKDSRRRFVPAFDSAMIYAGLGEKDRTFALLEEAYQENSSWLFNMNHDPRLAPLRSDPRFRELTRKVGLPE